MTDKNETDFYLIKAMPLADMIKGGGDWYELPSYFDTYNSTKETRDVLIVKINNMIKRILSIKNSGQCKPVFIGASQSILNLFDGLISISTRLPDDVVYYSVDYEYHLSDVNSIKMLLTLGTHNNEIIIAYALNGWSR